MKSLYAGPPLKELHEEYAKKGKIDENAPVKSVEAITIDAPVATVWQLLGDLRNAGIRFYDLDTTQSSLEDIFVSLVKTP